MRSARTTMTRINNDNIGFEGGYERSAQSRGFLAESAINRTHQEQQRAQQLSEQEDVKSRALRRQQELDRGMLTGKQIFDKAGLTHRQAGEEGKLKLIKGITDLSTTAAGILGEEAERQQELKDDNDQVEAAFGVGNDLANGDTKGYKNRSQQAEANSAQQGISSEAGVQGATSDPLVQEGLRAQNNETIATYQIRRGNAYSVAQQFPSFYNDFVNDSNRVFTRSDGSQFTALTMRDGADIAQVDSAARSTFYGAAGLKGLPSAQVISAVIPVVNSLSGSWMGRAGSALIKGRNAERQQSATVGIREGLAGGDNLDSVFRNGVNELFNSGNYVGNLGGANQDTVKEILNFAIRENRPELIEQLKNIEKIKGNKGTRLGIQYADLFEKAEEDVIDESLEDDQRERNVANNQIVMTERERQSALAAAQTPEEEIQINREYAEKIRGFGTPEADLAAAKLEANPNYSPFTALDLKEQAAQGIVHSQEDLQTLVDSGDITATEAKGLGWNASGGASAGSAAQTEAEEYKSDTDGVARAAVTEALRSGTEMLPEELQIELQGSGKMIINDISARLRRELAAKIQNGELSDDGERRAWIARRGAQLAAEVKKGEDGKLQYTYGGKGASNSAPIEQLTPTAVHPQTKRPALDLRGRDAAELKQRNDITIYGSYILSSRELYLAQEAVRTGKPIPASVEAKAQAIGTNGRNLLRGQENLHGMDQAQLEQRPTTEASSYRSGGDLSKYDTGKSYGGVSLDKTRNSIIGNESGGNYSAVNPHSGALGYGQVMPENVPSWSRAALGYTVSQRQFLANPSLQMKVINHRFESMMSDLHAAGYRGEELIRRTASIWYSGQSGLWNNTRPQYYNGHRYPSIANYTLDIYERYQGK